MAILPIGAVTTPFTATSISGVGAITGTGSVGSAGAAAPSFGEMLTKGIENVTALQDNASTLSGQMATGQLQDISEFTTAAAKASLGVSLTSNVMSRATQAYQEIMRMQI
jgi:flagellar hook-basal body complex protein FliE